MKIMLSEKSSSYGMLFGIVLGALVSVLTIAVFGINLTTLFVLSFYVCAGVIGGYVLEYYINRQYEIFKNELRKELMEEIEKSRL